MRDRDEFVYSRRGGVVSLLVALFVAMLITAGCGGGDEAAAPTEPAAPAEEAAEKQLRVGLVLPDFTQNELILAAKEGGEAAAAETGVDLLVEGSISADGQVDAVENMIAAGVDVLVYDTIDAAALSPAIQKANAAGIPVICIVACAETGEHAATIGYDYYDMGFPLGEWIASVAPSGKVGIIDTSQADSSVQAIYKGMYAGIEAGGSDAEAVISPPTNWDRAAALDIARDHLTANPDFEAVIGYHDLVAAATRDAMRELGYADVPLGGLGGTCEGLRNILEGRQDFTVIQPLFPAGFAGVEAAGQIGRGEALASTEITIPMIAISKERADAILGGSEEGVVQDVDVAAMLERAQSGC